MLKLHKTKGANMLKKVVKLAFVGLAGTMILASSLEARTIRWKLAETWPSTLTPLASPPVKVAEMVKKMSKGKFIIKVEGKEKHKAPLGILDMVKGGQYQMGHSGSYYWKGKDINTIWFTTIPFGMTADEQYAWFYYADENHNGKPDGMEYMEKVYSKFKVLSFPGGNTGVQMGGWFRKPINSVSDLKGLKMRIPGLAGEVMAKLGVKVTNIPAGELYTSLDRGVIDALEWVGPGMDIKMGFHKVAPYYYTGWHEPASEMQFIVNKRAFDRLPKEYQEMLITAMKAAAADMRYENFAMSAKAWAKMKTDYPNIKVKTFPKPVLKAMYKATQEVLQGYASKNKLFREIWENQKAWLKKARPWSMMSEYYYLQASQEIKGK